MPQETLAYNTLGWTCEGIPGANDLKVTNCGVPNKSAQYPRELYFNQGNSGIPSPVVGGGQHVTYGELTITYYMDSPDPCEAWFDECKNETGESLDGKKVQLTVTQYDGTDPKNTWQFEQCLPSAVGDLTGNSNSGGGLLQRTLTVVYSNYESAA